MNKSIISLATLNPSKLIFIIEMFGFKKKRRNRLLNSIFPDEWKEIVTDNVPYVSALPGDQKTKLEGLISLLIDEKPFEGCGGLQITDEIKITIAAQAGILLLNDPKDYFPTLRSILVYPHFYFAKVKNPQPDGTVIEGYQGRIGESWSRGHVVLSWKDVLDGSGDMHDGRNVVFHEFAHLLDYENNVTSLPVQSDSSSVSATVAEQYHRFLSEIEHGKLSILDLYAATNIKEFFAVSTEFFFEHPAGLKADYPKVYQTLKEFYQQDPITYFDYKLSSK